MSLKDDFEQKPVECTSAAALILLGIGAGLISDKPWIAPIGTAAAALGGALLSYAAAGINLRRRAARALEPELQSMARHLADTTAKLSRAIQAHYQDDVDSGTTIDRIAQLVSSLYASLNDIHVIAGSTTNFQTLVETVKGCEDMAARLEELTTRAGGAPAVELEQLRVQLESARMQLDAARKGFGETASSRKEESVKCPHCSSVVPVVLGTAHGESGVGSCGKCLQRFHVHRALDGVPFTRAMGVASRPLDRKQMTVECSECHNPVPLNFNLTKTSERRFCMNCCSSLTILATGEIADKSKENPTQTVTVGWNGNRQVLKCPKCNGAFSALWANLDLVRAACPNCGILLQDKRKWREDDSSDASGGQPGATPSS
jgi:hypothetical protein